MRSERIRQRIRGSIPMGTLSPDHDSNKNVCDPSPIKLGLVPFLVMFVAIVAVVLISVVLITRAIGATGLCTSTACVQYATILQKSITATNHPCDDFFAFVCEGWSKTELFSVRQRAFEKLVPFLDSLACILSYRQWHA